MKKVIELLQNELERQTILHMVYKTEQTKKKEIPGYRGPYVIPESSLFRDELEDAIAFLKTK